MQPILTKTTAQGVSSITQNYTPDSNIQRLNINKIINSITGHIHLSYLSINLLGYEYTSELKKYCFDDNDIMSKLLHKWEETNPGQSTLATLIYELQSMGNNFVACQLEKMDKEKPGCFLLSCNEGQASGSYRALPSVSELVESLQSVASKWYSLGEQLLSHTTVEQIEKNTLNCTESLKEVLIKWTTNCPEASLEMLLTALKSKRVSMHALAVEINNKYQYQSSTNVTVSRESVQTSSEQYQHTDAALQEQHLALQQSYAQSLQENVNQKATLEELLSCNNELNTGCRQLQQQLRDKEKMIAQLQAEQSEMSQRVLVVESEHEKFLEEYQFLKRSHATREEGKTGFPAEKKFSDLSSLQTSEAIAKTGNYPPLGPMITVRTSMKYLLTVVDRLSLNWYDIGLKLGINSTALDVININNRHNVSEACMAMLLRCLQEQVDFTWSQLAKAVYDVYADKAKTKKEATDIFQKILKEGKKMT